MLFILESATIHALQDALTQAEASGNRNAAHLLVLYQKTLKLQFNQVFEERT